MKPSRLIFPALVITLLAAARQVSAESVGVFEDHSDVGGPARVGAAVFDETKRSYKVTGGGANMWLAKDSFHFVWRKISGDVSLTADIVFVGKGMDPHRKACLLVRQSLDADAVYADAALHGDGLTSLQYRETKGAATNEVKTKAIAPRRLRLEKRGRTVSLSLAAADSPLEAAGSIQIDLSEPYYIGLGVCAHNDAQLETAVFSNVDLTVPAAPAKKPAAKLLKSKVLADPFMVPIGGRVRDAADFPPFRLHQHERMHRISMNGFQIECRLRRHALPCTSRLCLSGLRASSIVKTATESPSWKRSIHSVKNLRRARVPSRAAWLFSVRAAT